MHVEPVLHESTLILAFAGWNDAGDAATTAVRYVDAAIKSVPLAEIDSEDFFDFTVRRPEILQRAGRGGAIRDRLIVWPNTGFRYGAIEDGREVVTCLGIEPHLRWRTYCDSVIDLARALDVRRAFVLGAYQADVVYSQPVQVTGFATDPEVIEGLSVTNSDYQGPTGIVGVLASRFEEEGIAVVSLWAGLPHYINVSPNPRGALALVQKLVQLIGVPLDEQPLRESTAEFEERISKLVASDDELSEYVRQLKKREFAN
jgi:hypothetical protein